MPYYIKKNFLNLFFCSKVYKYQICIRAEEKNFIVFNLSMLYNNKNDIFIIIHTPPIDALGALCAANQAFFLQHHQGEISTRKLLPIEEHP